MSSTEPTLRTETDGDSVKKEPDLYGFKPLDGEDLYVWVPERHPQFEDIRDDFYGFAAARGQRPEDLWIGSVASARIPWKWLTDLEKNYDVFWVSEAMFRARCRQKDDLKKFRADRRKSGD